MVWGDFIDMRFAPLKQIIMLLWLLWPNHVDGAVCVSQRVTDMLKTLFIPSEVCNTPRLPLRLIKPHRAGATWLKILRETEQVINYQ